MTAIDYSNESVDSAITPEVAADVITNTLAVAEGEERAELVEGLANKLGEAGVVVVDVAASADTTERRGKRSGLTRQELLDAREVAKYARAMRTARTARTLGRSAI